MSASIDEAVDALLGSDKQLQQCNLISRIAPGRYVINGLEYDVSLQPGIAGGPSMVLQACDSDGQTMPLKDCFLGPISPAGAAAGGQPASTDDSRPADDAIPVHSVSSDNVATPEPSVAAAASESGAPGTSGKPSSSDQPAENTAPVPAPQVLLGQPGPLGVPTRPRKKPQLGTALGALHELPTATGLTSTIWDDVSEDMRQKALLAFDPPDPEHGVQLLDSGAVLLDASPSGGGFGRSFRGIIPGGMKAPAPVLMTEFLPFRAATPAARSQLYHELRGFGARIRGASPLLAEPLGAVQAPITPPGPLWLVSASIALSDGLLPLHDALSEHDPSVDERLSLALAIAEAVASLHVRGSSHGSLRSRCVFAAPTGEPIVISEPRRELTLRKPIGVELEDCDAGGVWITSLVEGGAAQASGKINVHDVIVEVSGKDVSQLDVDEVLAIVSEAPLEVTLALGRISKSWQACIVDAGAVAALITSGIMGFQDKLALGPEYARYLAPEGWDLSHMKDTTIEMDLWALGQLVLQCLGNGAPHTECSTMQNLSAKVLALRDHSRKHDRLPDAVVRFPTLLASLTACSDADPKKRPSAQELVEALRAAAEEMRSGCARSPSLMTVDNSPCYSMVSLSPTKSLQEGVTLSQVETCSPKSDASPKSKLRSQGETCSPKSAESPQSKMNSELRGTSDVFSEAGEINEDCDSASNSDDFIPSPSNSRRAPSQDAPTPRQQPGTPNVTYRMPVMVSRESSFSSTAGTSVSPRHGNSCLVSPGSAAPSIAGTSTSPRHGSSCLVPPASTAPAEKVAPSAARRWSAAQTLWLGSDDGRSRFLGRARFIDKGSLASVNAAVENLNSGVIPCPEGLCVVCSKSSGGYFLLYRDDMRDSVASNGGVERQTPRALPHQITVALTKPMGIQLEERDVGGVFVESLVDDGNAKASGAVQIGDVLTRVQAQNVSTLGLDEVLALVRAAPSVVTLTLERKVHVGRCSFGQLPPEAGSSVQQAIPPASASIRTASRSLSGGPRHSAVAGLASSEVVQPHPVRYVQVVVTRSTSRGPHTPCKALGTVHDPRLTR